MVIVLKHVVTRNVFNFKKKVTKYRKYMLTTERQSTNDAPNLLLPLSNYCHAL